MDKILDLDVILGLKESEELKPVLPLFEELVCEVLKDTENIMWKLARNTHIPGYDADDLMQEMRIRIATTLEKNNYDPERTKPTSFYYRVCKNCLIDLNRAKTLNHKLKNANYRDPLDQIMPDFDEILPKIGELPLNFVQNFSDDFKNLVLLDKESDEKRRID